MDGSTEIQTNAWTDGRSEGGIDGRTEGQMYELMNRCMD